ncbi:hypothetical protein TREMEDRAFT_66477 [Tremella mesenterica DSM 1558]|uniref:uncharacterized protein n=1 Tax=Tremella mesenterica (strain ATCC 24925 / CBS 8224 / DSM 1558 / NBRC 9311 / NRRL Y-6157 / RJB 2259-6 / UBC 559-6) TaxID=578456 RepID=UPI00032C7FD6|nr:uncharacterized protein TREMEDRAFT_66477 [Tremella mesenterica DSM 1558]EIW65564.1 hypothetical protein TREMEDRAFT_66477 [Tremella mesenterica DSM 1558]
MSVFARMEKQFIKSLAGTSRALEITHCVNRLFRMSRVGSMLLVFHGEKRHTVRIAANHYTYTVITTLGRTVLLHLPGPSCTLRMTPGDAVGLLTEQQLHKWGAE